MTEREYRMAGGPWLAKRYGLTREEAERLASHPKHDAILDSIGEWRERNGYPATDSPLVRGVLLTAMEAS